MAMDAEIKLHKKTTVQILVTEVKSNRTYCYDKCQCASVFAGYVIRTSKILNTLSSVALCGWNASSITENKPPLEL